MSEDLCDTDLTYKLHQLESVSLHELQQLYTKAVTELKETKLEFEEFQLTSKEYEIELENENETNLKRLKDLDNQNEKLQNELEKIKSKYNSEVKAIEKENELLKKQLTGLQDNSKMSQQKLVNLEIDNEDYERQLRISEQIISDLEQKLDTSLEEIALLQSELEELKIHSQEQLERLKQSLEETNTELQVKEKELKKLKFQQLLNENSGSHIKSIHQNTPQRERTMAQKQRMSVGISERSYNKLMTEGGTFDNRLSTLQPFDNNDQQDDIFERRSTHTKRPESARLKLPINNLLAGNHNSQNNVNSQVQHETIQSPVREEQDSSFEEEDILETSIQEEQLQQMQPQIQETDKQEQQEKQVLQEEQDNKEKIKQHRDIIIEEVPKTNQVLYQEKDLFTQSQPIILNPSQNNEFEDNLLMDDLDIDELLECEDIEQTVLFSSSKQLLNVIDNVINCIDNQINTKRNTGYYSNYGYQKEMYGPGQYNNNLYGGYHKQQSQSSSSHHFNNSRNEMNQNLMRGVSNNTKDQFDKQRKISVLY